MKTAFGFKQILFKKEEFVKEQTPSEKLGYRLGKGFARLVMRP